MTTSPLTTLDKLAYTIPDAVRTTGLSRALLYRAHDRGELPFARFGKSVRILGDDLAAYLRAHREPDPNTAAR